MRALLLALILSACSLKTEAPLLIDSYACNWQLASDETTEPKPGYCWSIDPRFSGAMTLASTASPCDVDATKVHSVGPDTHIRVWVRTLREDRDPDVWLAFTPGEDCQ